MVFLFDLLASEGRIRRIGGHKTQNLLCGCVSVVVVQDLRFETVLKLELLLLEID